MKTLLLLRHAQAEGMAASGMDVDRRLTDHGRRQAVSIGKQLRARGLVPDSVLSSTAARARETADFVLADCACTAGVRHEQLLFNACAAEIEALAAAQNGCDRLMIVGHNPGLGELARELAHHAPETEVFAPAHLAGFEFDADEWSEIRDCPRRFLTKLSPDVIESFS